MLVDVIFPTNLPSLTYICPVRLEGRIFRGALVSAPVRGKIKRGVVYALNAAPARGFTLKELSDVHGDGPVLSNNHMDLLSWMTDYYFSKAGLALDAMLPGGWLEDEMPPSRQRANVKEPAPAQIEPSGAARLVPVEDGDVAPVREAVGRGGFSVFLLKSPTESYELSYVLKCVTGIKSPLVLFPETQGAARAAAALETACGAAPCLVRGETSRGEGRALRSALTGEMERPIAGGLSAVLAPASWKPSIIVVTREHSRLYKHEGAPRFSARDVAVMRGFIEKIPVLLTSITPSASSWYNAKSGKYAMLPTGAHCVKSNMTARSAQAEPSGQSASNLATQSDRIEQADSADPAAQSDRSVKSAPSDPTGQAEPAAPSDRSDTAALSYRADGAARADQAALSNLSDPAARSYRADRADLADLANRATESGQSAGGRKRPSTRVINMRGIKRPLSPAVLEAIGQAARAGLKSLVLVNRKGFAAVKCPECGHMERCPRCGAPLMLYEDRSMRCTGCRSSAPAPNACPVCSGSVFDNVGAGTERIEALIKERLALAPMRIDSEVFKTARKLSAHTSQALKNPVVVGTRIALKEYLFAGHFHVCVLSDADMYLNIPDFFAVERLFQDAMRLSEFCTFESGRVFIQTRNPSDPVFGFIKSRDVDGFMNYELARRSPMSLPPYSKMARVTVFYRGAAPSLDVSGSSNKAGDEAAQVEIMGPIESRSVRKGFSAAVEVVVKAGNSALLSAEIKKLLRRLPAKTTRTDIDVDPVGFL
jgi:primosomal protein N'